MVRISGLYGLYLGNLDGLEASHHLVSSPPVAHLLLLSKGTTLTLATQKTERSGWIPIRSTQPGATRRNSLSAFLVMALAWTGLAKRHPKVPRNLSQLPHPSLVATTERLISTLWRALGRRMRRTLQRRLPRRRDFLECSKHTVVPFLSYEYAILLPVGLYSRTGNTNQAKHGVHEQSNPNAL